MYIFISTISTYLHVLCICISSLSLCKAIYVYISIFHLFFSVLRQSLKDEGEDSELTISFPSFLTLRLCAPTPSVSFLSSRVCSSRSPPYRGPHHTPLDRCTRVFWVLQWREVCSLLLGTCGRGTLLSPLVTEVWPLECTPKWAAWWVFTGPKDAHHHRDASYVCGEHNLLTPQWVSC